MEEESLVGQIFAGRFLIESIIGRGGMGVVYLANHEVLQRRFAIKVLRKNLLADPKIAARFRREARAASRVEHPHITYVFDFGHTEEGRPYIAMEYEDGPTLAQELVAHGYLSVARAINILAQCADALAAAHDEDVIHRDLKPRNIILVTHRDRADYVKILDFGLAKIEDLGTLDEEGQKRLTMAGQALGTLEYMSPEQCLGDKVDARTDIYSLGMVGFELLVGRVPFAGANIARLAEQQFTVVPPAPSVASGRSEIPEALDVIIGRCLAKQPGDRYQHAADLGADLQYLGRRLSTLGQERRKTARLYAVPGSNDPALRPTVVPHAARPEAQAAAADPHDDEATVADWPGEEQSSHNRRSRALEELACAARDRGIGSPEISQVLTSKLEAEDSVIELEADLAVLEATAFEVEMTARERESRLRQALNQLEHEMIVLQAPTREDLERIDTQPWDTGSFNLAREELARLQEQARGVTDKLQSIAREMERELAQLKAQEQEHQAALRDQQQEAQRQEERLAGLLGQIKATVLELDDGELAELVALARL